MWVNTYRAVSYMAPFGGYKDSGLGRENGQDAIREYSNKKRLDQRRRGDGQSLRDALTPVAQRVLSQSKPASVGSGKIELATLRLSR